MSLLERNKERILRLCQEHRVGKLFVFGSVLTNKFSEDSDIDFLVDFSTVDVYDYADNYFSLKDALEKLFQRPVDLLELQALKNPFLKKEIDSTKELIYG